MMDKKIIELANKSKYDSSVILAFIEVETSGKGFDPKTGKIIIQFEPHYFKKFAIEQYNEYHKIVQKQLNGEVLLMSEKFYLHSWKEVISNKVSLQKEEWNVFEIANDINPVAAKKSTSFGLGQIMGFHWKRLGFISVEDMWEDANKGVENQFNQLIKFIDTDPKLSYAIKNKNWSKIASIYNGAYYKELAKKLNREPYDISMSKAYEKFLLMQ